MTRPDVEVILTPDEGAAVLDLLAVLHRDGGHYTRRHGLLTSLRDAAALAVSDRACHEENIRGLQEVVRRGDEAALENFERANMYAAQSESRGKALFAVEKELAKMRTHRDLIAKLAETEDELRAERSRHEDTRAAYRRAMQRIPGVTFE